MTTRFFLRLRNVVGVLAMACACAGPALTLVARERAGAPGSEQAPGDAGGKQERKKELDEMRRRAEGRKIIQNDNADKSPTKPERPADAASLKELEQRVRLAAEKVLPAVVAVEGATKPDGLPKHSEPFGSGVIITADGLILSQYHVTHLLDRFNWEKSRKAGERVTVILRDGRRCEAELLGADRSYDLSLLRLVKPGPYPYTPLAETAALQLGDPVLKLGHPLGYRPGRDPVVRLGRVLYWGDDSFVPDCLIEDGDSGGPLFDLDGRLAGIVRNDTMPEVIPETLQKSADMGRRIVRLCACSTNSLIRARMDAMRRGEFPPFDAAAMAKSMEGLRKATETLPVERWSQGRAVLSAFRDVVAQARSSVVGIQDGQDVVALGTVVGADGWIVTKASQLPAEPKCRLPDGRVVAAAVAGIDPAFDVALLKVSATGLRAIECAEKPAPTAGTFLAAPGAQELPLAVGVVSVPRRDLPGPFPTRVDPPRKRPAALPEVIGSAVQGRGYWVEFVEGRAAAAGIQPGDVILTIAGKPVRRHQDLADCVKGHWAGQRVPVRVHRAGKTFECTMRLRAEGESSSVSLRADDFPAVFEHDMPILNYECGGPVVDLAGKALGITIARVGKHGCMAIPGDCIQRLLPDLKSGKLAGHWSAYREALALQASPPTPTKPKPGKPVTLTLDELKRKLTERAERFKSLLVEYDVVAEAHVEPRLLMAWNMLADRDYQERHRIAFAGPRRFNEELGPEVVPHLVPQDQVVADPNSPPSVAQIAERQRRSGEARKQEGRSGHLFSRTQATESRWLFDGSQCFHWDAFANRMLPVPNASLYYSPTMYLAGLGLRPIDPQPDAQQRKNQQRFWFPENFALYQQCRILPNEEAVDGAACIVVEAQRQDERDGKRRVVLEKIWLDPKLGFAPRQWEQWADAVFESRRTNSKFDEFAPGCWLPWESTWTLGTPAWVAPELRNQPALTYNMRLRKARVNDVSDDLFKP